MSKKLGTMLGMALDPRTPEPEAIAALRALRNLNPTTEQLAEALADRISDSQPSRARVKPNSDGPRSYGKWWDDFDYRDPFQGNGPFGEDFLRRGADEQRRRRSDRFNAQAEAMRRQQEEAGRRDARLDGAMNTARHIIANALVAFEAEERRKLLRQAGVALATELLDPQNSHMRGSQIYQFVEQDFVERMMLCGDTRAPEVIRAEFSILHAMIMARPHGHYV